MRPGRRRGAVGLLAAAIAAEVSGTLLLRISDGFTRPLPMLGTLLAYGVSMLLFSRALIRGTTLGIAYATLTGCGLAAAVAASTALFGDPLTPGQTCGLGLLAVGVVVVQTTARAQP